MNKIIGLLYSTVDGQSLKICKRLANYFHEKEIETEMHPIAEFNGDVLKFDFLIIGASIRYGFHNKKVTKFINTNRAALDQMPVAFFSVNLVARQAQKSYADTNPYLVKYLKKIKWTPDIQDVFAGKLDYQSYSLFDAMMIKLIMKITKGPTKSEKPIEFTDWNRVDMFGQKVIDALR